jgi:hypothetical protein
MLDDQTLATHISGQFPLTPKISTGNDDSNDNNDNNDFDNDFDNINNNDNNLQKKLAAFFERFSSVSRNLSVCKPNEVSTSLHCCFFFTIDSP